MSCAEDIAPLTEVSGVEGRVQTEQGEPVEGAKVSANTLSKDGASDVTTTDENGTYRLVLPPELYEVYAQPKEGFSCLGDNATVKRGEFTTVDLSCHGDARSPTPGDASGIEGRVVAGPTCPVETPDEPCEDRPVANARVKVQNSDGKISETMRSRVDGRFRVEVPPGSYEVTAEAQGLMGGCEPEYADVVAERFVEVEITCDTGIR
jgi:hypothetical protein